MTLEDGRLGRVRLISETTFGVDQSSSMTGFCDLPVAETTLQTTRDWAKIDTQELQQYLDQYPKKILGPKSCSVNFSTPLASHNTPLLGNVTPPSSVTSPAFPLGRLLKIIMGGEQLITPEAGATTVVTGSTSSVINVSAGNGDLFTAGQAIGCIVNGKYEAREVKSRATDAITVKVAFSGTPATGTAVLAGTTYYLTENPSNSAQLVIEGAEQDDRFVYCGLQGGFSVENQIGGTPRLGIQMQGAQWVKLSQTALAAATYSNFGPMVDYDSELIVHDISGSTRQVAHAPTDTWTPGLTYAKVTTPGGVNTVLRHRRTRARAIAGQITTYLDGSADVTPVEWQTYESSRTNLGIYRQIGSTAGAIVLLSAPTVQVTAVQRGSAGDLSGLVIDWEGRHDACISSPANELQRSAFRIHFL